MSSLMGRLKPVPSSPIILPHDSLIVLHLLSHIPVITIAYLLFSPSPSNHRLLRALLSPLAVWFCIYNAYLWRASDPAVQERQKGLVITGTIWAMRAVEMGYRRKAPRWLGWEEGETDEVRDDRRRRKNDTTTFVKRLKLAAYYCYSYRSLGWDTGAARSKLTPGMKRPPTSRTDLILSFQLPRLVRSYAIMDLALGFWSLHPYFSHTSTAQQGSIYTPLHLVPFFPNYVAPWWISSSVLALLLGFNLYTSQAFTDALISTIWSFVCDDPEEFALHDAEFYTAPWMSRSFRDLWTYRWHKLYRAKMLFCGYTPGYWLGNWIGLGSFGGLIGTFILSGAFHAVGYYDPFSDRPDLTLLHSKYFFMFFIYSAILLIIESFFPRPAKPGAGMPSLISIKLNAPFKVNLQISWVIPTLVAIGTPLADVWLRTGGAAGLGAQPDVLPVMGGAGGRWVAREVYRVLSGDRSFK